MRNRINVNSYYQGFVLINVGMNSLAEGCKLDLNLYIGSDVYDEPEWMHWENMPEYDAPVPKKCIEDKMWKMRTLCPFCEEPIEDGLNSCRLHGKHFRKPAVRIIRR